MSDITTEQMCRAVALWYGTGRTIYGSDEDERLNKVIQDRLTEYDTLKAEVDELATKASHLQHDLFCEERDRNKAEAELERARPLLKEIEEASDDELDLTLQSMRVYQAALAYRKENAK